MKIQKQTLIPLNTSGEKLNEINKLVNQHGLKLWTLDYDPVSLKDYRNQVRKFLNELEEVLIIGPRKRLIQRLIDQWKYFSEQREILGGLNLKTKTIKLFGGKKNLEEFSSIFEEIDQIFQGDLTIVVLEDAWQLSTDKGGNWIGNWPYLKVNDDEWINP